MFAFGKRAINIARLILGIRVEVIGLDRIDKEKTCIYMANHLSFIDGPLLFWLIPQKVRVLLKKEAFRYPVIGLGMKFAGFVPVDRSGLKSGKKSIDRAEDCIRTKGYSFLIFPEGTRSRDGRIQSFRRGAFFLAVNSQVPVVPVSISGSYELMPKGSMSTEKGHVRVVFHPEVSVRGLGTDDIPGLIEQVRSQIISGFSG